MKIVLSTRLKTKLQNLCKSDTLFFCYAKIKNNRDKNDVNFKATNLYYSGILFYDLLPSLRKPIGTPSVNLGRFGVEKFCNEVILE